MWKHDSSTTFDCILHYILHKTKVYIGKIERLQRENDEKQDKYPAYILTSQSRTSIKFPTQAINKKVK